MPDTSRKPTARSPRLESLEDRKLLTLIGAKPTLEITSAPGVRFHGNSLFITQPAVIQVSGTAQPGPAGSTATVSIFAEDSSGNLVNGGQPLATVTPDALGRYNALVKLPSRTPKDVNILIAREEITATQTSRLVINGTTLSGLTGTLALQPGTLSNLAGLSVNPATTLTNFAGTVSNPGGAITGFGGTVSTPATPISGIAGVVTIPVFPTTSPGGPGTAGPAVGAITGGSGTLGAQVGTLAGGSGTIAPSTSTLAQTGVANIAGTTSTFTQTGTADESSRVGSFSQTGTASIAPTTGLATTALDEVAVSDPITVYIHVPPGLGSLTRTFGVGRGKFAAGARFHAAPKAPAHHRHS